VADVSRGRGTARQKQAVRDALHPQLKDLWNRPPFAELAVLTRTDADGGPLQIIIRQIIDSAEESEPLLIEHETQTRD
jgi:hypothetical protein